MIMTEKSMTYSNKKVLIIDTGMSCMHAERIARDVGHVYYWSPVFTGFPKIEDYANGYGLDNVERVLYPFSHVDKVDLIVIMDVGYGDIADFLRKHGHVVFGAGSACESLEFDRFKARQIQEKLGLPVQFTVQKKGLTKLTEYLTDPKEKNWKDTYIKPNIFRGMRETTHISDERQRDGLLRKLEARLGPMREAATFICEDGIKGAIAEPGFDILFNGKEAIKPYSYGLEKDGPYLMHYRDDLPGPLQNSLDKLSPLFKKLNYRGAFSDEELVISKNKSYIIDFTCRWAQPLSHIFTETWKNYTEVIFKVASGDECHIEVEAPFGGCLPLRSDETKHDWLWVDRHNENKKNVKLCYGCQSKEGYHAVKGYGTPVNLIAWGKSVEDVVTQLKDLASEITAHDLDIETSGLDAITADIDKLKEIGMDF